MILKILTETEIVYVIVYNVYIDDIIIGQIKLGQVYFI